MSGTVRLADLLAGLSVAADAGMGLPSEESMRASVIATGIARRLDLADDEVRHVLYATLLLHLGCTGYAHERAAAFGDEVAFNGASARADFLDPLDVLRTMVPALAGDAGALERGRVAVRLIVGGNRFGRRATTATCEVGRRLARRLGLPDAVQRALYEAFELWNGKGTPHGLDGEEVTIVARVARVAATAARLAAAAGREGALDAIRARAGGMLDPRLCELFAAHADELIAEAEEGDPRELVLEREPQPVAYRRRDELPELAAVFADYADLKTPFTHGHSREVARLAVATAQRLRLGAEAASRLELAGLLHDLGRVAVSSSIWEKPGPLTGAEWEQVRLHPYRSERILAGSEALEPLARLAGTHHERLDGSGYHRGCEARELPAPARVLAAADAYQAMTQRRPHRDALDPEQAAEELGRECRTNREIAERLVISRRTAEHHVQHIYAKIGESSRPPRRCSRSSTACSTPAASRPSRILRRRRAGGARVRA